MNAPDQLRQILRGMDKTWNDSPQGWWERRADARFGEMRLCQVLALASGLEAELHGLRARIAVLERAQPRVQHLPADDTEGGAL